MPRIRTFKPEFFRSPDTAKASHAGRILFMAMWSWADDEGIGETNLYGLLGFAFPDEDELTVKEIQRLLTEVGGSFGVLFYGCRGRFYYAIPSWNDHQKTERRANGRHPKPDHPDSYPDLRFGPSSDTQGNSADLQCGSALGTGEQGNIGTGEQKTTLAPDREPSLPEPEPEVVIEVPEYIDNPSRQQKRHPTNAARTVVRQTLGGAGYPKTTIDRLAIQVGQLARDHPDHLIRESLTAWDQRPGCDKPEFLPTVLSDVLKRSRSGPAVNGHDAKVADFLAYANQPRQPEIER